MSDERLLEVGRIIKAHGLRGQLLVDFWTDRAERWAPGAVLTTSRGPLTVRAAARHQDRFLVSFEGVDSREDAEAWRATLLLAPRVEDEDDDAIWIDDLYGATVYDASGTARGVVVDVEANPASDLLVLDSGTLVPLTFVTSLLANERIDVDAPDGLFE
ncbi:MAG: 16S rRNA processing protein RimM [Actinomycetales bacterium]|nr:16S rRNA processing protein RimM [Actinomycetales bacterium]